MRFTNQRRRNAPAVIIISLIDVLIVLLIFVMVTMTFRQQPALKLTLPESKQAKQGSSENNLIITVSREEPFFYIGPRPVTFEKLQEELKGQARKNPKAQVGIHADSKAPWESVLKAMDAAREAGLTDVRAGTRTPASR